MAKLINWNNFNQGFGESFNQTISELRRLREQREQFDQEMGFRERQLGLEKQRIEQTGRYYDQLDLARKFDIYQNLYPSQEGQPGAMTGGDIEKQFGVDIYNPEQEKGFFSPYKPETPSMPDNLWEDVTSGVKGTGDYLGQKVNILRNRLSNEERQVPVYIEPKESGSGGDGGSTGNKPVDISTDVGELQKLISFYDMNEEELKDGGKLTYTDSKGNEMEFDYKLLKANMDKYMNDILSKAGVPMQGDLVSEIRQFSGVQEGELSTQKRQKLLDAIDYVRSQGKISDSQYEALRYWAQAGTR